MKLSIRSHGYRLVEETRLHILERIQKVLDSHEGQISRMSVYITDVNARRGGEDKLVRLVAALKRGRSVCVSHQASDLKSAVEMSLERLDSALWRRREKKIKSRRRVFFSFGQSFAFNRLAGGLL